MENESSLRTFELPSGFLREITNDFSIERIVSESAYATVFKVVFFLQPLLIICFLFCGNASLFYHILISEVKQGILHSGEEISVKRFSENCAAVPDNVFWNEAGNLMQVEHQYILRLIGVCFERKRKVVRHDGRYIVIEEVESYLCHQPAKSGSLDKYIYGAYDSTSSVFFSK
jgi:disease resistance protein RPM1